MTDQAIVLSVPIAKIGIPDDCELRGDLAETVSSIEESGLLQPIMVNEAPDGSYMLVHGFHRLKACEALGWEKIPASVRVMDPLHAELARIDENIIRHALGTVARGVQLARRKAIYEGLHPETRHVTERGGPGRGNKTTADSAVVSAPPVVSFVADTAAKTGRSERSIREDIQIAEDIIPEVKEMIRETPVADHKMDLMEIARTKPERQPEVAQTLIADRQLEALDTTAYRSKRKAMREEREREEAEAEAEAEAQQRMIEERADVDGVFALGRRRQEFRDQYKDAYDFFMLKPEAFLPMITDADRTNLDAFVLIVRRWCDRVETLRRPHLQVVGSERHVEIR